MKRFLGIPKPLLAITVGRLVVVPIILLSFDSAQWITAVALATFVAVDLYDGILARSMDSDDTVRRVLDTSIDRLAVWPVYLTLAAWGYVSWLLILVFAAREIYCGYWGGRLFRERDVVVKADWLYRSFNLMLAGWVVVAPLVDSSARNAVFAAVLVYSIPVARDLGRSARSVFAMPALRAQVIQAGTIRRLHTPILTPVPAEVAVESTRAPTFTPLS